MIGPTSGDAKIKPSGSPGSGQYFYDRKLVQQPIQDTVATKFRRSGSSSTGASSDALLLNWAANVWAVGTSVDDVSILSILGGVVWTVGSTIDALPPGMVRTSWRVWLWRLLHRRQPVRECWPPAGQKGSKAKKPDGPEPQTGWSNFPKENRFSRAATQAIGVKIRGC
jgi:hypothetical protein